MLKRDQTWMIAHQDACKRSLWLLARNPWSSLMTIVMIAVILMLAMLCWLTTQRTTKWSESWQQNQRISLYLQQNLPVDDQERFLREVRSMPGVGSATLISPEEGLALLAQQDGMEDILQYMPQNPLPALIQVIPDRSLQTPQAVRHFFENFQQLTAVAEVKFDSDWLDRLYQSMTFIKKFMQLLMILFAIAVAFVIGNTLRLMIHHRQEEIQVLQWIGAPHGFIRRPFLYSGVWYGCFAASLAVLLIDLCLFMLRNGLNQWAEYYQMHLTLSLLSFSDIVCLLAVTIGLSWTGARLTLNYYI